MFERLSQVTSRAVNLVSQGQLEEMYLLKLKTLVYHGLSRKRALLIELITEERTNTYVLPTEEF